MFLEFTGTIGPGGGLGGGAEAAPPVWDFQGSGLWGPSLPKSYPPSASPTPTHTHTHTPKSHTQHINTQGQTLIQQAWNSAPNSIIQISS